MCRNVKVVVVVDRRMDLELRKNELTFGRLCLPCLSLYWKLFSIGKIHHNLSHLSCRGSVSGGPAWAGRSPAAGGFSPPTRAPAIQDFFKTTKAKTETFWPMRDEIFFGPWLREVKAAQAEMSVESLQTGWGAPEILTFHIYCLIL